jgi:hypothetical protein
MNVEIEVLKKFEWTVEWNCKKKKGLICWKKIWRGWRRIKKVSEVEIEYKMMNMLKWKEWKLKEWKNVLVDNVIWRN